MIKGRSIWSLLAFVVGFFVFARIRGYGDNTGIPIRYRYPVQVDHWLFNGHDPVLWLQNRLGQTGSLNALDYFLIVIYISYFVVPPATIVLLWWFRSRGFSMLALAIMVTLYVGVTINFIVPTAPPWLAAAHGYMTYFPRLVPRLINSVIPGIFNTGDSVGGANDVAAMPSLHIAIICAVSFYYMTRGKIGIILGSLYILGMAFTLVYLGEHYFSDIVAGFVLALASWLIVAWALGRWEQRKTNDDRVTAEPESPQTEPAGE